MNERPISKTDFLIWRECAKNAWLKIHRPEVYYKSELSDFEKAIIETGNEVELEARKLYPTGVLIEKRDAEAQDLTKVLLAEKSPVIFQPVILQDSFLAAVDILKVDEATNKYAIIEIKASNQIQPKIHLPDLAFQVNLLRKTGLEVGSINLMHLNPEYIREGELDITKLFILEQVDEQVHEILDDIEREMDECLTYLSSENEPPGPCTCVYKGRSAHCTTFSYSNPHIPEYSVHDIARIGLSKNKLRELIDGNIYELQNIPETIELSEVQTNQVNAYITKRPKIRADKIAEELRSLVFPLYFLDYETFPCAVPRFDGYSPYQQVLFQYSLHVVEAPGKEPVHFEFLHEGADDPSKPFAGALMRDIGKMGTVIVWNKKFEMGRNDELALLVPEAKSFLADVNARIYDLMDIFSKQYHVHQDFMGSTSIKYVLPVLAPDLSYKKLNIREGGTASQKWNEMVGPGIPASTKKQISRDLREYCKLDTYAMYAIWKHLFDLV